MSSTHYRNRSNLTADDSQHVSKSSIRESCLIQPEQWQSPEVQEKFAKVMIIFDHSHDMFVCLFSREILASQMYMEYYNN